MIEERELLLMPNRESIASVFGHSYKTQYFDWRDGDLLLFIASAFSDSEIDAALKIGGKLVQGYAFDYHYPVSLKQVRTTGWCASAEHGVGFALSRKTAEVVSAASYAAFKEDIQRCYAERERKYELGI